MVAPSPSGSIHSIFFQTYQLSHTLVPATMSPSSTNDPVNSQGKNTGYTSIPGPDQESQSPTMANPYQYQPAISSHPKRDLGKETSNYAQAIASAEISTPSETAVEEAGVGTLRRLSYSRDDHRRKLQMEYYVEKEIEGNEPLKSPGIGNSKAKGREHGFTSTG
jgi:hypothetical protein